MGAASLAVVCQLNRVQQRCDPILQIRFAAAAPYSSRCGRLIRLQLYGEPGTPGFAFRIQKPNVGNPPCFAVLRATIAGMSLCCDARLPSSKGAQFNRHSGVRSESENTASCRSPRLDVRRSNFQR